MVIFPCRIVVIHILALVILFVQAAAASQQYFPVAELELNAKLLNAGDMLAGFQHVESSIPVIISLQHSPKVRDLAMRSGDNGSLDLYSKPGAAPYNLRDLAVRRQLRDAVAEETDAVIQQLAPSGMQVIKRFSYQFGFAARVTPAALTRIVNHPQVVRVEKDGILEPHINQGVALMNAVVPRSLYDGTGVSIAICDTGIDSSHPRLGGTGNRDNDPVFNAKVIGGYDVADDDNDPRPHKDFGEAHGTACAGIAAGDPGEIGENGDYIGGVAPGARLYDIKISGGDSSSAYDSDLIKGWEWAITHQYDDPDNPILIISTSFGGGKYTTACDSSFPSMAAAAANAEAAGIMIFASSGNSGYCDGLGRPACISSVNSVGAVYDNSLGTYGYCVDSTSCAAKIPNAGCSTGYAVWDDTTSDMVTCYSNSASFLTLFAPSNNAFTTDIVGEGGYSPGDFYSGFGGTSAASPYAAGAAAVLQSAAKTIGGEYLTPQQVKQSLVDSGDPVTDSKVAVTRPRINLTAAAAFLTADYLLTVDTVGIGSGRVSADITPGIDCGSQCTAEYPYNTWVSLMAEEDDASVFMGWSGACTGRGSCLVVMDQARSVTAVFERSAGDMYEPDDSMESARTIVSGEWQDHTLLPAGDTDYLKFTAEKGLNYQVKTTGIVKTDTMLAIVDDTGTPQQIVKNDTSPDNLLSNISWKCPASGTYYIKVSGINSETVGPYTISLTKGGSFAWKLFLPVITGRLNH